MYGEIEVTQEVKVTIQLSEMKSQELIGALYEKYNNAFPAERKLIEDKLKEDFPHLIINENAKS
jgi:hypothetical protein